ncbi:MULTISPECIES: phosphopantetheine-binding protein [Burkholderia]|uniref:phosphopantetheine-binding protein n=1 Tax=Burkholderia TaxID=32008 RepID=UPI00075AF934|nr:MULTISPECIES: phosphopantetheine-binding protein [Burkholderia]AOJ73531.1 BapB protein [Burkholderia savannae]KVG38928.1 BapB protein [Burkholderia sp. MSMB0265]KVG81653.1 BapB protein [Burkholderia sp. MSMB2040]KVG98811.1 BapB protein [Burkholderia sp. MSMB2042]KVG98991.1 BapB protein [Burkholderia sp. MSMB2041]
MSVGSHLNETIALSVVKTMLSSMLGVPNAQIAAEHRLLEDLSMDSLELIELAMELEERWNIRLDRARLNDLATVGNVAELLSEVVVLTGSRGR